MVSVIADYGAAARPGTETFHSLREEVEGMRTLPLVLTALLVNDALLLLALDVTVPTWLVVVGVALAFTVAVLLAVGVGVEAEERPSNADLDADVASLRDRVATLEAATGRENG